MAHSNIYYSIAISPDNLPFRGSLYNLIACPPSSSYIFIRSVILIRSSYENSSKAQNDNLFDEKLGFDFVKVGHCSH